MATYVQSGPRRHRANDRLKALWPVVFWGSTTAAALAHTLAFAFWPSIEVVPPSDGQLRVTTLMPQLVPPEVLLPRDPIALLWERIVPALPVVSAAADVLESELTLPVLDFDGFGAIALAPPRVAHTDDNLKQFRAFVPTTVLPELLNRKEMARQVSWQYERHLSFAGATGQTVVRIWLDRAGKVEKHEIMLSSGDRVLDRIAEKAVALMRFSPALHLGQTTEMVVTIPVSFQSMLGNLP
jgi:TonB family protein